MDVCPAMVALSRQNYPEIEFQVGDAHEMESGETFDYIICSDLVNELWDVQQVFEQARKHSHSGTRLIINNYSRLWEIPRRIADALGLAKPQLPQNWLTVEDIENLLELADFETIRTASEIMCPLPVPLIGRLCNRYGALGR